MTIGHWAWLLVVLAAGGWVCTVILVRASARVSEPALQERAFTGVLLSLASSIFAIMAAAYLLSLTLPAGTFVGLLVLIAILLNVPQMVWAALLALGRFQ